MKSVFVWLGSPAYSPAQAGPCWAGGPAEPQVPRRAQADHSAPRAAGADYRKCSAPGKSPAPSQPPLCPTPPPTPSHQMQTLTTPPLYDSGSRAEESVRGKTKGIFFDLIKGAGPRHLKGLSGHHTSCRQGHFTLPPPPALHLMPGT